MANDTLWWSIRRRYFAWKECGWMSFCQLKRGGDLSNRKMEKSITLQEKWKRAEAHSKCSRFGLVSSMPFRFPFHLPVLFYNYYFTKINKLTSCWPIHFQIILPTFQKKLMKCATLKRFAAFAHISFVVQRNLIPNDNIQSFQLSFELHF